MSFFKSIKNIYKTVADPASLWSSKKGNYISGAVGGVEDALGAHQETMTSQALKDQAAKQKALDDELVAKKQAEDEQARNVAAANRLREIWAISSPYTKNNTIFTSPSGSIGQPNLGGGLSSLYKLLLGA